MTRFDKYDVILSKPEEHTKFTDGQSGKERWFLLEYKWIYLKSIKKFEGIYGWIKGKIEISLL